LDSKIDYVFDGTPLTEDSTLPVTWYDGASRPPADVIALLEGDELPNTGSILVGTKGVMLLPHIGRPLLYPDSKFGDFIPKMVESNNHWTQYVDACLGKDKTSAPFDYSGPLTEAVLLGGVASRFPKTTLTWNAKRMKFDLKEANQFVRQDYRKGWKVKGLS
jgi:hypothetical protein